MRNGHCFVRDAGGDEEDVAGAGGEGDAGGRCRFFRNVVINIIIIIIIIVAVVITISPPTPIPTLVIPNPKPNPRRPRQHSHTLMRPGMVVRRLRRTVAVDPLRGPPVAREELVDGDG